MASSLEVLEKPVLGIIGLGWCKGVTVTPCRIYEVSFSDQSELESYLFGTIMSMGLLGATFKYLLSLFMTLGIWK